MPVEDPPNFMIIDEKPVKFIADPVMYLILRRDLMMPAGKACAQAAHAAVRLVKNKAQDKLILKRWFDEKQGNEAKVTFGVLTMVEFEILVTICENEGFCHEVITDAAYTVFNEPTVTCLGVGPIERKHSHFFKHLRLF